MTKLLGGRYLVHDAIASGGMATVHLGRHVGPAGFARTVAVKRLHEHLAQDGAFAAMLLDEGRVSARIQHPHVVQTLDVVADGKELAIILEYVHGASLSKLEQRARETGERIEPPLAATIAAQVLRGLHAAHEVEDESGTNLGLVHRDVSPQNVLVGADGAARVLDFGIAKALGRAQTTREGEVKGKLAYMSPEQLQGDPVDRRTDVFAASIVLWEMLTGERLFGGEDQKITIGKVLRCDVAPPSARTSGIDPALDAIVVKGLARAPADRYPTAEEMARALEEWKPPVSASRIAAWVDGLCHAELTERRTRMLALDRNASTPVATIDTADLATKSAHSLSIELVSPRAPAPLSRRRSRVAFMLGAAALVVGAATLVVVVRSRVAHAPQRSSEIAAASPTPSTPAPTEPPVAASALVAAPPAAAAGTPASPPSALVAVASAAAVAAPPPKRRPPPPKVDCTDPYVLDAQGKRRYRRECLTP